MSTRGASTGSLVGDRYKKLKKIGEGGMQEVFKAEDTSLQRTVALKIPMTAGAKKRFDRSAKQSAKVIHPNVAATLDYVRGDGEEYLIEELVPGSDLQARFDRDFFAVDANLAAHVLHHVAKGVAAVHHAGVVHRDLKPSNIIVSNDPGLSVVKVTDFGIAKMAGAVISEELDDFHRDSTTITGSKTLVGAIPYMAPEALQQSPDAGQPADVWAIGAIGYWLVSGVPPFGTGIPAIARILGTESPGPPPYFGRNATLNRLEGELLKVITRCMNRNAAKRPTADELVALLGDLCYSTRKRYEGKVDQVGIPQNASACFAQAGAKRVFFHRQSFQGFGNALRVGERVTFCAYPGQPHDRSDLVLLLRSAAGRA
jgi:serine/threonine protein kinase